MVATALLVLAVLASQGEGGATDPQIALLPSSEAWPLSRQCSREPPPLSSRTWDPGTDQLASLRSSLTKLLGMKATKCCMPGRTLTTLSGARIQVVGIITPGGKRILYLNALPPDYVGAWHRKAEVICDGGAKFWGVVYDPELGTFSELAFNGVG